MLEKFKVAYQGLSLIQRSNGRIGSLEEITEVTAEAVAELLKPIIRRKLMERQLSARSGTIGLLRKPDLSGMSPREVIRLFLKLQRSDEE